MPKLSWSGTVRPDLPLPHLFLFPGMGGYDPDFCRLGALCAKEAKAAVIIYPHWTELLRRPDFNLEALVSLAAAQIVACSPVGPILLAGYSFGGIVAFAVAQRMRGLGLVVGFLGLLDIEARPGNDDATGATRPAMTRAQELVGFLAAVRRGEGAGRMAYVVSRRLVSPRWKPLLRLYSRIPRWTLPGKFGNYLDRDLLFWHFRPLLRQWAAVRDAASPIDAASFLFRTTQHDAALPDHLGWASLCRRLMVVRLPGTHLSLVGACLPQLGAAFRQAIGDAQASVQNAEQGPDFSAAGSPDLVGVAAHRC